MSRKNRRPLPERVVSAAEAALADKQYVSAIDVFLGLGWLDFGTEKQWRQGQIDCLERVVQSNLPRISEAMALLRSWANAKGLLASETQYLARTPQRQSLRFSRSGDPTIERLYRTHWVSSALSEKKRERMAEKASSAPELVVVQPLNDEWTCHKCSGTGELLMMEGPGPACMRCAGLDDLEFLFAGDPLLTRRAKAKSARYAVVVRFSRARRRYERQGLLVEPRALREAQDEIEQGRRELASAVRPSGTQRGARTSHGRGG
jgi:hypothetical protein